MGLFEGQLLSPVAQQGGKKGNNGLTIANNHQNTWKSNLIIRAMKTSHKIPYYAKLWDYLMASYLNRGAQQAGQNRLKWANIASAISSNHVKSTGKLVLYLKSSKLAIKPP